MHTIQTILEYILLHFTYIKKNLFTGRIFLSMRIAIVGRTKDTKNYERYISSIPAVPHVTLSIGELSACDALVLPGGGDITPAFFGERNAGSFNIDTELDILQLQAFDYACRLSLPVLGICKGMQIINVALGGTITQDLPTACYHKYQGHDQYHITDILEGSCLHKLYGKYATVNSAHHQAVKKLGVGLQAIQWCPIDNTVEAVAHQTLPILGLQWHPERIDSQQTTLNPTSLLSLLTSWISTSCDLLPNQTPT